MTEVLVQKAASYRIDEIYRYTFEKWGKEKADSYIEVLSRPIPTDFGIDGFFFSYQKHFVYWKYLSSGAVGIVTILHERMHQIDRFKDDFVGSKRPS